MSNHNLLLVDPDVKASRILEISLTRAGFDVFTATESDAALAALEESKFDLVIVDTVLPSMGGFELCRTIKSQEATRRIPIFLTSSIDTLTDKIRGLELGVEEYLVKPIHGDDICGRIRVALGRRQRTAIEEGTASFFEGNLRDTGLHGLIQTVSVAKKSAYLSLAESDPGRNAIIDFRDGQLIDAECDALDSDCDALQGEAALIEILTWSEAAFELRIRPVRKPQRIFRSAEEILIETLGLGDECPQEVRDELCDQAVLEIVYEELFNKLSDLPDELNRLLRLFNGKRTLKDVVDISTLEKSSTLEKVTLLVSEDLLRQVEKQEAEVLSPCAFSQDSTPSTLDISDPIETVSQAALGKNASRVESREAGTPKTGRADTLPGPEEVTVEDLDAEITVKVAAFASIPSSDPLPRSNANIVPAASSRSKRRTAAFGTTEPPPPPGSTGAAPYSKNPIFSKTTIAAYPSIEALKQKSKDENLLSASGEDPSPIEASILKEDLSETPKEHPVAQSVDEGGIEDFQPEVMAKDELKDAAPEPSFADSEANERDVADLSSVSSKPLPAPTYAAVTPAPIEDVLPPRALGRTAAALTALGALVVLSYFALRPASKSLALDTSEAQSQMQQDLNAPEERTRSKAESLEPVEPVEAEDPKANRERNVGKAAAKASDVVSKPEEALVKDDAKTATAEPKRIALQKPDEFTAVMAKAKRAYRKKNRAEAIALLDEALAIKSNTSALLMKAEILLDLGDARSSLALAEKATKQAPRRGQGWLLLGRGHQALSQKSGAQRAYARFLQLSPESSQAESVRETLNQL